jgi:hypothetical protein
VLCDPVDVRPLRKRGGIPNKHLSTNIPKLNLNDQEKLDLIAYVEVCTGKFPKVELSRLL